MSVLSYQSIKSANIIRPFVERTTHMALDLTYGCGAASYDIRLDRDIYLIEGYMTLASTLEEFSMPIDVCGIVHDKSSLARAGILVQNTFIDPGWGGYLTLEISYHQLIGYKSEEEHWDTFQQQFPQHLSHEIPAVLRWPDPIEEFNNVKGITLLAGTPIAQIVFHYLDEHTEQPYSGRYQNQARGAQPSKLKGV